MIWLMGWLAWFDGNPFKQGWALPGRLKMFMDSYVLNGNAITAMCGFTENMKGGCPKMHVRRKKTAYNMQQCLWCIIGQFQWINPLKLFSKNKHFSDWTEPKHLPSSSSGSINTSKWPPLCQFPLCSWLFLSSTMVETVLSIEHCCSESAFSYWD